MALDTLASPVTRTYYESIKLLMTGLGYPDPGTVLNPDRDTARAIEAFNLALTELWYAHQWDWRYVWFNINLIAEQMWFDIEDRFYEVGANLRRKEVIAPLKYLNWEQLTSRFPQIRHIPDDYGNLWDALEVVNWDEWGIPAFWSYRNGNICVWPIPDQDFLDQMESILLVGGYYANMVAPTEDADELEIGIDLYPALHMVALGHFKESMEWPDARLTQARGDLMLAQGKARARRVYLNDSQLMPEA